MTTFVDSSALYALIDEGDPAHETALAWIEDISAGEPEHLRTHSYVVVETIALTHARLGPGAVRMLVDDVLPACEVRFVDGDLHRRAITAYLAGLGRRVSFVDRASFELMREERIEQAFAFDPDFRREGFETVP
ncbi:MAG: type II toxin-antitoxin system VapC family toxin [Actinomycetota bacterium]